jgi:hypothetical protein
MIARLVAALAALGLLACTEAPPIARERFAREAKTDLTGLALEQHDKWVRPPPPPICEIGAKTYCFGTAISLPPPTGGRSEPLYIRCIAGANGVPFWSSTECNTPLVISFDDLPVAFTRARATFAIGVSERTEWVSAATPWVALDRDGSGCIESARELFAGFEALAELDANGDGRIDARDPAFAELVLWSDRDQDKRCTPDELAPLADRVEALPLAFAPGSVRTSSYEGDTVMLAGGVRVVDVHLAPLD